MSDVGELTEFLTTEELSAYIRVPTGTLRNWRHRRYGPPGFKVGNTVLYRRTAVDVWLARQEEADADRA